MALEFIGWAAMGRWWTSADGIAPWAEDNQGLTSVLALVAALGLALHEQRRALKAEARARQAAEVAKLEAELAAREADIARRMAVLQEFAVAARGVILEVERDVQDDLGHTREFMFEQITFHVPADAVRQGARASADTLTALLAATPLSPALIRATRQGVSALHAVGEPVSVCEQDYQEVYSGWLDRLAAARSAMTDAELEMNYRLRPPAPSLAPEAFDESGHR